MKKKGFTLVELLAVIAILAILVIIALPNVLNMYRDARKKSFENEAKELYRSAQQQYLFKSSDMGAGSSDNYFIFASDAASGDTNTEKLDIQGGTNVKYCIRINNLGVVTKFYADNGTYSVTGADGYTDVSQVNVDEDRANDGANYGKAKCQ